MCLNSVNELETSSRGWIQAFFIPASCSQDWGAEPVGSCILICTPLERAAAAAWELLLAQMPSWQPRDPLDCIDYDNEE